jgi:hypothetical protein
MLLEATDPFVGGRNADFESLSSPSEFVDPRFVAI